MEKKLKIPFRAFVDVGDYAIGVSESFNGIFKVNYEDYTIEYIGSVPGEKKFGASLYCDAILSGLEVIFIPFCAKDIAVLNLETMEISKYPLPKVQTKSIWKFSTVCRYQKKLILIPGKYEYILSFDLDTHRIEKLVAWKSLLSQDNCDKEETLLAAAIVGVHGKRAYIQVMYTNILLVFNMERGVMEDKVYLPDGSYTVAMVYKDDVWIVPSNQGSILKVSVENLNVVEFCDSPLRIEDSALYASVRVMCQDDKLYMFPQRTHGIGIVDLKDGIASVNCDITDKLEEKYGEYPSFFFIKEYASNRLFVSMYYKKSNIYSNVLISLEDMSVDEISFVGKDEWKKNYLREYVTDSQYSTYTEKVLEKLQMSNPLEMYVEYLKSMDEVKKVKQTASVGKTIHDFIKGQ